MHVFYKILIITAAGLTAAAAYPAFTPAAPAAAAIALTPAPAAATAAAPAAAAAVPAPTTPVYFYLIAENNSAFLPF
ncbi:hypothetical protein F5X96DRAFT_673556 [Biscogniauxia mediterranea]|nr:hypothetical protein F5X96DRAFT_673556 [Biscogniauxia mediterranea]